MINLSVQILLDNAALLLALGAIYEIVVLDRVPARFRQPMAGFLVGFIGIALMAHPWETVPGIIFDTRSILLSLAGLFFGWIPASIAVVLTGSYRFLLGGAGYIPGIAIIVLTAGMGLLWRHYRVKNGNYPGWKELYVFGLVVQLSMLPGILILPEPQLSLVLYELTLPVLIIYPVVTVLLGILLGRQLSRQRLAEEQKRQEQALRRQTALLRSVIDAMPDLVMFKDKEGRYLGCNRAVEQFTGVKETAILGKQDMEVFNGELAAYLQQNDRQVLQTQAPAHSEQSIVRADGERVLLDSLKAPVLGEGGELLGLLGISRDVTEHKENEAEIRKLAFYDTLTELPNRRYLMDRLGQSLKETAASGEHGAILFIDLDNFKTLNDTRGHDTGDQLLIKVAKRLQACVRAEDTVARLGGDEFLVMIEGLSAERAQAAQQTEAVAAKIRNALNRPYTFKRKNHEGGHEYRSTPSIGISIYQGVELSVEELLKQADMAMYQSKGAGRNSFHFFQSDMQSAIELRAELESELHYALPRRELEIFCQPQYSVAHGLFGAEVLMRWRHGKRGLVSPAQFIPLAEENGLILPMGQWVLETACMQLAHWSSLLTDRPFQLAVNVSPRQFRAPDFIDQVKHALQRSGAQPQGLKLELTEGVVLHDVEDTIRKMQALQAMGIGFSMDDFGTGYSSLSYLKRLPLDQLKIDQSFVRDIHTNPDDAAIVQAIIAITKSLGLEVIAEGVETDEQRSFLEQHGCHAFQGYFFGRPVPAAEFTEQLRQAKPKA